MIALPAELSTEDNARLVRGFAAHLRERYGIAATWSIHAAPKGGDERNRHAHILITTRKVDASGTFGEKTRTLDDRKHGPEEIKNIRTEWEKRVNAALERAGSTARVSSKRQSIEPLEHLGPIATAKERRGMRTAPGNRNRRRLESRARARAIFAEIQSIEREQAAEDRAVANIQAAAVWRGVLDSTQSVDARAKRLAEQLKYLEDKKGRQALLADITHAAPIRIRPDCWAVLRTIAERAQKIVAAAYHGVLEELRRMASGEDRARLTQRHNER